MRSPLFAAVLVVLASSAMPSAARAGVIVGGSELLTPAYLAQLESWLGEGALTVTNVYAKAQGDTSAQFHAAADGRGRTFAVVEVVSARNLSTGSLMEGPAIVGGYNPQSWSSVDGYHMSPPSPSDAFLFNLTGSFVQRQQPCDVTAVQFGCWQSYNVAGAGPVFGGGHDLYVGPDLASGHVFPYSYVLEPGFGANILGRDEHSLTVYNHDAISIGRLEVFAIESASPAVPEPSTVLLFATGALALGRGWRRVRPQKR